MVDQHKEDAEVDRSPTSLPQSKMKKVAMVAASVIISQLSQLSDWSLVCTDHFPDTEVKLTLRQLE